MKTVNVRTIDGRIRTVHGVIETRYKSDCAQLITDRQVYVYPIRNLVEVEIINNE